MASLATAVPSAISPKKRRYADFSGDSEPLSSTKRMHSFAALSSGFQKVQNEDRVPSSLGPKTRLIGLEGLLDLDQPFVEATRATEDDEVRRAVQGATSEFDLDERRRLADEISGFLPRGSRREGIGLPNINGVLCYRHSLFQALLHTPKFVNWIIQYHKPEDCVSDNANDCVSCHMRNLAVIYWTVRDSTVDDMIERVLVKINAAFKRLHWHPQSENGHGDPDDQLGWILERMRHEMPSSAFRYFEAFQNSVLESEIVCDVCGNVSRTEGNNERHFPIPISSRSPRHRTSQLSGLIDAYMDEIVDGYRCEKEGCNSVAQKHRIQKIMYAPDTFMVQLKRFSFRGSKDSTRINFAERLNLSRHAANQSQSSLSYELVAVICHQGSTGFGHYICVARTDTKSFGKTWSEYDDHVMCNATINTAINPAKELGRDWTPYLLFYKRIENTKPEK